jgi:Two component regulator propeller.
MVEGIVKVYTKSGSWEKIVYPQISYMQTNPKSILIDRYSNKWIITLGRDEGYSNYIFVFNENGTISNTSDDKYKYQDTFINQNGNALSVVDINCIAEDNNGTIWVGTNIGPFYISNSSNIANQSGNIVFNKPMIERGSESSSVIGLLENVVVNSIAVDGANRKWIGTQNIGVFLLSADRKEVLASFNADNSPLPSNNIISLSVNPQSGDVYIGTDKGLMAYKSGVTQGSESFSDVYVYPNPVHPDYSGLITVTGLMTNSRVKITDVKGNLIIEGKSSGGQFVWDGLNGKGRRVDTGIYLVFGSSEDGSEGVVTKIMFIKE